MKEYIKKYGMRVGAAVMAVVLIVALAAALLNGRAGLIANISGAVSNPVGQAAQAAIEWVEGIYGYIYQYDQLVAENNSLRAQLAQAQQAAINATEIEEENERLRELLNFASRHSDYTLETAKITEWSSSNWESSFRLSKGANAANSIEVGDCVITEYGALVGQVVEVGDTWCSVRTIVDSAIDVGALVGEAGAVGMCVGDFSLMQQNMLRLTYLSENTQLVEGEAVLTSGRGSIPQGLIIGYISSVLSEGNGQNLYGIVEPACDLGTLTQVFIICDFTIQE